MGYVVIGTSAILFPDLSIGCLAVLQRPIFPFVVSAETADALVCPLHEFVPFLAIPFCLTVRIDLALPSSISPVFTNMARSPTAVWSELLKLGELMRDEPSKQSRIYPLYFGEENPPTVHSGGRSGHRRPATKVM